MGDLLAAACGLVIASPLRYGWDHFTQTVLTPPGAELTAFGMLAWTGTFSAIGTYRPAVLVSRADQLARAIGAALLAWVAVHLLAFGLKVGIPFESRLVTGLSLPATLVGVAIARLGMARPVATRAFARLSRGPVLFVGDGDRVCQLARKFERMDLRMRRTGVCDLAGLTPGQARWTVEHHGYGEVVIVPGPGRIDEALVAGFASLDAGAEVTIALDAPSRIVDSLTLDPYDGGRLLHLRRLDPNRVESLFKRTLDLVGATAALLVLLPVLLAIALAVKLSSPGPVIYAQERVGRRGRRFFMYKFRTMQDGNDPSRHQAFLKTFIRDGAHAAVAPDGSKIYKPKGDPRVTKVGAWLRRFSLDELPQLWNVLRGQMSLVGPRPCLAYEWELYSGWHRRRLDVMPGCTGLWQVRGRSRVRFDDMVLLDLHYAHHGTLFTDLRLILETIPVMLLGRGAY
jgi:exopolysaccharide biosynthesis polyprenyl glycosylphosphotransferase